MTTLDTVVGLNTGVVDFVRHYGDNSLRRLFGSNERITPKKSLYELGLEYARNGEYGKAIDLFAQADLRGRATEDDAFFETIANTMFTINFFEPGYSLDKLKSMMNRRIKPGVVKRLFVSNGDGLVVDFGNVEYEYQKDQVSGKCRNDVSRFNVRVSDKEYVGSTLVSHHNHKEVALKFYNDKKDAEKESAWLDFFEEHGRKDTPRLVSSGGFGDWHFNQIGMCEGMGFAEAISRARPDKRRRELVEWAADKSISLYQLAKKHEAEMKKRTGMACSLSRHYYSERFDEFEKQLRQKGYGELADKVSESKEQVFKVLFENRIGIIHNDYAPRNMLVIPGQELVIIDHEDYAEGHPIIPVITFVKNPENRLSREDSERIILEKMRWIASEGIASCNPDVIKAANIFWDCRQARRCPEDKEKFEWYVNDLKEVMGR